MRRRIEGLQGKFALDCDALGYLSIEQSSVDSFECVSVSLSVVDRQFKCKVTVDIVHRSKLFGMQFIRAKKIHRRRQSTTLSLTPPVILLNTTNST